MKQQENYEKIERSIRMKQQENYEKKMTGKEKLTIAGITGLFAAIGAVLGVIAYYQQWLG